MVEKNVKKLQAKKMRGMSGFNTGIRTHKSAKYPSREMSKILVRKQITSYY